MISPLSLTITLISDIVIEAPGWRPKPICVVGMETENPSKQRACYTGLPTNRWDDSPAQNRKEYQMEKFIPYEKLSKKKKRELNASRRGTWGTLNPVTRKPEPHKAYNRRKAQKWKDDSSLCLSCVLH